VSPVRQHDTGAAGGTRVNDPNPRSAAELAGRWVGGTVGVGVLALLLLYDVNNAQTVVEQAWDRSLADGRAARAHSWAAAGCSALVITAIVVRLLTRRPAAWLLWLGGAASVCWSLFAVLVTVSLFT
jgi:uncharacterized BrkB/YihY/UPF0761 family membrane protein